MTDVRSPPKRGTSRTTSQLLIRSFETNLSELLRSVPFPILAKGNEWGTKTFTFTHMTDVHSTEIRSYNMSRIKGKNTKPEMLVRRFLFANGFRYRLNVKTLPGKPDIVLPKYKTVIFVNGCFWHGHKGCRYFILPKTRTEWWLQKINDTKTRDQIAENELAIMGWKVIVIWECELKKVNLTNTLTGLCSRIY